MILSATGTSRAPEPLFNSVFMYGGAPFAKSLKVLCKDNNYFFVFYNDKPEHFQKRCYFQTISTGKLIDVLLVNLLLPEISVAREVLQNVVLTEA